MEPQFVHKEKSVIIHRDENGFGLRVGGQNPVFVDCVHENGAAWKAGVRKDDRIIKVNGTLVKSYDHQTVVHMIQNCSPFVNLTLHSLEATESYSSVVSNHPMQSTEQSPNHNLNLESGSGASGLLNISNTGSCGSGLNNIISNNNNNNSLINNSTSSNNNNNNNNNSPISKSRHQRLHPHSLTNNSSWLLNIGHDLFDDSQQKQQPQQQSDNSSIPIVTTSTLPHQPSNGVSKLIVSGPSPLSSSHSRLDSSGKPKSRHNRSQASTRDNPYYYYKTAPEKVTDLTSANSATASLLSDHQATTSSSKSSTGGLSIVRSRSSSKMSTRSTISGKYKARNLRSRLVEDLKSLSIVNSQLAPSSLSTSPSSSDLSDCDDPEPGLDCLSPLNTSSSSTGPFTNTSNSSINGGSAMMPKSKKTTHRLEIIRELVDTEKTHTERLKHLNDLLYKPIKAEGLVSPDQLKMVFSCHKTLFKIHRQIYKILSTAQMNTSGMNQEPLIGKALVEIFEGELGKRLEKAASAFCACQSTNTELLNRFTRKDTKAGEFLAQVATQQMLGRLGIKDLLASCFQRLTKYPLLLENLLKATPTVTSGIHSKSLSEGSISLMGNSNKSPTLAATILPPNDLTQQVEVEAPTTSTTSSETTTTTEDIATTIEAQQQQLASNAINSANHDEIPAISVEGGDNEVVQDMASEDCINESIASNTTINTTSTAPVSNITATTTTTTTTNTITTTTIEDSYCYERLCISRALHQSRQILVHVNDAVKRAVAQSKLKEIWKKTEKQATKPVIDIETQQLLHEGNLTLRLAKRTFEVYVILLTQYLVILTREGQDKYKLKHFNADGSQFSPIFNIDEHLATRDTATDENGFYLLCKRSDDARIYEFASQSPMERAKWKEKIHMAQQYNTTSVPDDDNTLTRYTELISLAISSNTPNNIETNNILVDGHHQYHQHNQQLHQHHLHQPQQQQHQLNQHQLHNHHQVHGEKVERANSTK